MKPADLNIGVRASLGEEEIVMSRQNAMGELMIPKNSVNVDPFSLRSGIDRFDHNDLMIWGMLPLSIKVSSKDTGGEVLLFEHKDMGKGGPPKHIHFEQDEWFYVIKGEYAFVVGDKSFSLKSGDTLFAPRNVPHAWANVGEELGTLLTMVSPVGSFEEFILDTTKTPTVPSQQEMEKTFLAHGMKYLGPPLI